jgi:hypothetical protein
VWNCHPEPFGSAQDKLREGSAFQNESLPEGFVEGENEVSRRANEFEAAKEPQRFAGFSLWGCPIFSFAT